MKTKRSLYAHFVATALAMVTLLASGSQTQAATSGLTHDPLTITTTSVNGAQGPAVDIAVTVGEVTAAIPISHLFPGQTRQSWRNVLTGSDVNRDGTQSLKMNHDHSIAAITIWSPPTKTMTPQTSRTLLFYTINHNLVVRSQFNTDVRQLLMADSYRAMHAYYWPYEWKTDPPTLSSWRRESSRITSQMEVTGIDGSKISMDFGQADITTGYAVVRVGTFGSLSYVSIRTNGV